MLLTQRKTKGSTSVSWLCTLKVQCSLQQHFREQPVPHSLHFWRRDFAIYTEMLYWFSSSTSESSQVCILFTIELNLLTIESRSTAAFRVEVHKVKAEWRDVAKKIEPVPVLSHQELSMSILSVLVRVHAGKYVNVCVCVCTPNIKQLCFF